MVAKKSTAPASGGNKAPAARPTATTAPVESSNAAASITAAVARDEAAIASSTAPVSEEKRTADGGKGAGPKSALAGGEGSEAQLNADGTRKLRYSVQCHTDAKGLEVFEPIDAESGDAAANSVLAKKGYAGVSIRGVQPYSDPDANSLGGERDAAIMIANGQNTGAIVNSLGTDANAEATSKLAKADVKDLGE